MAVESGSGIWSLVIANPLASDDINQGDDHFRLIKSSLKQTFPQISATVNVSEANLNHLSGIDSNIKNSIDTISTSLQAEISKKAYGSLALIADSSEFSVDTSLVTFTTFDTPGGVSSGVTENTTSGALVVTTAGHYSIAANFTISSSAATSLTFLVVVDDITTNISTVAILAAGTRVNASMGGIATAGAANAIQVKLKGSTATAVRANRADLRTHRVD